MTPRRLAYALLLCLLAAGCAAPFDPPMAGDHAAPKYRADLVRCRKQASNAASRRSNVTPQAAIGAIFASGDAERADVTACMTARGYAPAPGGA